MSTPINDLGGRKFGKLLVIGVAGRKSRYVTWNCKCECGGAKIVIGTKLVQGLVKSCGCRKSHAYAHGYRHSPEYAAYCGAKKRCNNTKVREYALYGARGIKFLFNSFGEFIREVGDRPSAQHSIDRINNDGNYEPGNIRWATKKEQALNRRKRRWYRAPAGVAI